MKLVPVAYVTCMPHHLGLAGIVGTERPNRSVSLLRSRACQLAFLGPQRNACIGLYMAGKV